MIVYQNTYVTISFSEESRLLRADWNTKTEDMTDEEFKTSIQNLWENLALHKPKGLLAQTKEFLYTIPVEVQEWYGQNMGQFGKHTRKVAMMVTEDILNQISLEQTIEEDHTSGFQTKYFESEEKAIGWLLS
jgi:hypothetical protein